MQIYTWWAKKVNLIIIAITLAILPTNVHNFVANVLCRGWRYEGWESRIDHTWVTVLCTVKILIILRQLLAVNITHHILDRAFA